MTPSIVITGCQGLIGQALVRTLAPTAPIIAIDLHPPRSDLFPDLAVEQVQLDVSRESEIQSWAQGIKPGALCGLINNAAIAYPYQPSLSELPLEHWQKVLDVNLTGPMLMSKHLIPALAEGSGIVNIASTRAHQSEPNCEAYAASKGGLVALTHALAISLGPKLRVNCISPGWISDDPSLSDADHDQHPCGRVGRPEDVAHLAAFLLSQQSGFVTAQNWTVDGGIGQRMRYEE
ncbi:SDR family oxidoreductase [Ferrimonas pelagia]|uniref:Glucose 1-dehydrogenase n=1 Tax=Ferrimonas pelagia TaxID=1177826 RepID=A0ABP9EB10_9GAMM